MKTKTSAIIVVLAIGAFALWAQERPSRSVWDGVYSKEQATRGQSLFNQHCASCHGATLEGIEMAPALAGADFLDKWAGQTVGDLFERIRTTMPMGKAGRLSRDINADIVAYMVGFNQFPAGETELPRDTQMLKQIRIDATKPQ